MIMRKILLLCIFLLFVFQSLCATPLAEQFKRTGYLEICNKKHGTATFDPLYAYFEELIVFLQINPVWAQKLYSAKERFIRSKDRNYYSTDFFGFYDESEREGRRQISFYYSTHFHEFICSRYPEFNQVPEIMRFFEACLEIQKPYGSLFDAAAAELGLEEIFSSKYGYPPILLKIVKYLPSFLTARTINRFFFHLINLPSQSTIFLLLKENFPEGTIKILSYSFPERF